jgi:hypothetical protein
MRVREVQPSDEAQWRVLWDGYNSFYGAAVNADVTSALWRRLTTPDDTVFGRVAEDAYGLSSNSQDLWMKII